MIIEFIGPPGAGKTTLIEKLVAPGSPYHGRFQALNLHAFAHALRKSRTAANLLHTMVCNPRFVARIAAWALSEKDAPLANQTALKLARLERPMASFRRKNGIFLIDEGLNQRAIWSFAYFGSSVARFEALARSLPNPDLFVVLSETPTVSLERIQQRSDTNPSILALDSKFRIQILLRYQSLSRARLVRATVPVISAAGGASAVAHAIVGSLNGIGNP